MNAQELALDIVNRNRQRVVALDPKHPDALSSMDGTIVQVPFESLVKDIHDAISRSGKGKPRMIPVYEFLPKEMTVIRYEEMPDHFILKDESGRICGLAEKAR